MKRYFPPWGIIDIVIVLGTIFLITNFFSWLMGGFIATLVPVQRLLLSTMLQTGSIVLVIVYFIIFRKAKLSDIGIKKGKSILKVGILGGGFLFGTVLGVGIIMELLLPITPKLQPFAQIVLETENFREFLLLLFIGSVLAPLGEELYFRGLVYPVFKNRWGLKKGMLFTGVFFALLHFDVIRFVPLAIGGAGLAYLYEKTGSILTPMLAHGIWNGIMMFLLYFIPWITR